MKLLNLTSQLELISLAKFSFYYKYYNNQKKTSLL